MKLEVGAGKTLRLLPNFSVQPCPEMFKLDRENHCYPCSRLRILKATRSTPLRGWAFQWKFHWGILKFSIWSSGSAVLAGIAGDHSGRKRPFAAAARVPLLKHSKQTEAYRQTEKTSGFQAVNAMDTTNRQRRTAGQVRANGIVVQFGAQARYEQHFVHRLTIKIQQKMTEAGV